jgi:predicted RNase H-like HicB family nuclease
MEIPIQALIYKAEEGGFWAKVTSLPACATGGETMEEIEANLREAVEGWLGVGAEVRPDPDDGLPVEVLTL